MFGKQFVTKFTDSGVPQKIVIGGYLMDCVHISVLLKGEIIMANSLVQFRTDDTSKIKATNICECLGIDLPTYMRMCISRLIQENGIPFSMKLEKEPENRAVLAMKAASRIAEENGIADMTLDEINAEITEARKQGS